MTIWTILRKELTDNLRDRRGMLEAILIPLIIGVIQALLIPVLDDFMMRGEDKVRTVPVVGLQYAGSDFIATMKQFKIELVPYEGDTQSLEEDVRTKAQQSGLVLSAGFDQVLETSETSRINIYTNQTAGNLITGAISHTRLFLALEAYNQQMAARRLIQLRLDPGLLTPLTFHSKELSTPAQRGGTAAAAVLTLMVVYVTASGGLYISIDVTAGEKERGTLEALFVTPVSDAAILMGKTAAVSLMSLLSLLLSFIGFYVAANLVSNPEVMTLPLSIVITAVLLSLPVGVLINVVTLILTVRTKAFKDAQSAATPLLLILMLMALAAAFIPAASPITFLAPIYGAASAVAIIASGGSVSMVSIGLSVLGTLLAALGAFLVALRVFNREHMLYG